MNTYSFSIVTPNGRVLEERVESLVAPGVEGSFGVWAGHAPMVAALKNGPLTLKKAGEERYYSTSAGILEVSGQGNVLLLCDYAVEKHSLQDAKFYTRPFASR
ncbi:MAG TPA: ATP synthase F1 subunit epsilon [Candidatus Omnitrophica bacterium]|nr:ATP synthase F1 subunit epsilon [Candidatus Omnitrophota bacterium]HCI44121.1 ATP synthase F1 subunit epsilon [Candidatus Omnitrophota bacterium]